MTSLSSSDCCPSDYFGSDPTNIKWHVVRGDTATLTFQFFENDEVTLIDTSTWTYTATAYDVKTSTSYSLLVDDNPGSVTVTALPIMTELWGSGVSSTVAELNFDLEVNITPENVWTPVIGTITVIGDISGATL